VQFFKGFSTNQLPKTRKSTGNQGRGANRFAGVVERHIFVLPIENTAATGITKGCNPTFNTKFCPAKPLARGPVPAFFDRAGLTTK
jgi:hypothetical protein